MARLERVQRRGPVLRRREHVGRGLNTNLCTAVAMLMWVAWDLHLQGEALADRHRQRDDHRLVAITPAAGYVNGYGAIIIAVVGSTVVWISIRYLSRAWPFRDRRRHARGDLHPRHRRALGGLLVGLVADPKMNMYPALTNSAAS